MQISEKVMWHTYLSVRLCIHPQVLCPYQDTPSHSTITLKSEHFYKYKTKNNTNNFKVYLLHSHFCCSSSLPFFSVHKRQRPKTMPMSTSVSMLPQGCCDYIADHKGPSHRLLSLCSVRVQLNANVNIPLAIFKVFIL